MLSSLRTIALRVHILKLRILPHRYSPDQRITRLKNSNWGTFFLLSPLLSLLLSSSTPLSLLMQ